MVLALRGGKGDAGEEYVLGGLKLRGLRFFQFALNFAFQIVFGPKMETRLIFPPQRSVRALRQRAMDDLEPDDQRQRDTGDPARARPYISEGDVLSAWGAKLIDLGLGKRKRALTVMNVFDMRSRLGSLFDHHSTAYVQNAISVGAGCRAAGQGAGAGTKGVGPGRGKVGEQRRPARCPPALFELQQGGVL